jgi:Protein of unknown function (DUF4232)
MQLFDQPTELERQDALERLPAIRTLAGTRRRHRRRLMGLALAAMLAVGGLGAALAACGQTGSRAAVAVGGSKSAAEPSTTPATGAAPSCRASQVHLRAEPPGALLGTAVVMIAITNVSGESCSLFGYPSVQVLGARQQLVPVTARHGEFGPKEPSAPSTVVLTPKAKGAVFGLSFTDHPGPASAADCRTFLYVRSILPGRQLANIVHTGSLQVCGGRPSPQLFISPIGPDGKA